MMDHHKVYDTSSLISLYVCVLDLIEYMYKNRNMSEILNMSKSKLYGKGSPRSLSDIEQNKSRSGSQGKVIV